MHTFYPNSRSFAPAFARLTPTVLVLLVVLASWRIHPPPGQWLAAPPSLPILTPGTGMSRLPLSFVPNTGQSNIHVRFQALGLGGTLFFSSEEIILVLPQPEQPTPVPDVARPAAGMVARPIDRTPVVTRLRFEGANRAPDILGGQPLPGRVNYFQGDDPSRWQTNVPTYAGITYSGLYPGIDLRYDGTDGRLKGTYTLAAGADPKRIRWRYDGASRVRVDETTGDLLIDLVEGAQPLTERAPVAWQEIDGRRVAVTARYVVGPGSTVSFALGSYDPARPLTIDPTLEYSTFLGGSDLDDGHGVVVDQTGNIYVTGSTTSSDFPTLAPIQAVYGGANCQFPHIYGPCTDAFIAKFDSAGQLIYSTYLGGDQQDTSVSIAVDGFGNAYITGDTWSANFPASRALLPVSGGGGQDGFVAKLGPSGSSLVYALYLGGNSADHPQGIAVDSSGAAVVTGETLSMTFPTIGAIQPMSNGDMEGFATKVAVDGSRFVFSTYLGGSGADYSQSVALDGNGAIYLTGYTTSSNFPIVNHLQSSLNRDFDAFVTKISPNGSNLIYSTYFGGSGGDMGYDIAVDAAGSAYIAGLTYSADLPLSNPMQSRAQPGNNAFITKFSPAGNTLGYSTYIGNDAAYSIAVDAEGYAYVTGYTQSDTFPLASPIQAHLQGQIDCFVAKLNRAGNALLFSSYLGGSSQDYGYGIAVDGGGHIYLTGRTWSNDFPTVNGLQATNHGASDVLVSKISIPTTTIVNTLVDGLTNKPLSGKSGLLSIYRDATLLETAPITTDAQGVYQATFSGLISGSLRLGYSRIDGYPAQFEDRRPTLAQADSRLLVPGTNVFTTRLLPSTSLTSTLLDDTTGLPIAGRSGTLTVVSGTLALEAQAFETDAAGVFTINFSQLISQPVHLEYDDMLGYPRQYVDRHSTIEQADMLRLTSGANLVNARLAPSTTLIDTLRDNTTGAPIVNAHGRITVYSGTLQLDSQPFQTDASGVFTVTFTPLISQSVRLEYSEITGYPTQFYDRALATSQSRPVALRSGANRLDTRLIPYTTLTNTLLDDRSGLPISLKTGTIQVFSGTTVLEQAAFTTDANGIARITFSSLISQSVRLAYGVDGYFLQFYDRAFALDQAAPIRLRSGANSLTTRLVPATRLVNSLIDDSTGLPLAARGGFVDVYSGTTRLESRQFTTDASGVFTATFRTAINQDVALRYTVDGYARQFYDRRPSLGQADRVALFGGRNTLITRLIPSYMLANTLLDDPTGQPIANSSGLLTIYLGAAPIEQRGFRTDASGVYTITLGALLNQDVRLEYSMVAGHARQFYDRALRIDQSRPLTLQSGRNQLTTRLVRGPTLANTLLDDRSGLPLSNTLGVVEIYSGTLFLESHSFMTDASGVFTSTLINTRVGQQVGVGYSSLVGYARQFHDRKPQPELADPLLVRDDRSTLTTRLAPATVLAGTMLNDATGMPVANTSGLVNVYTGTTWLDAAMFTTDANGVYTATLRSLVDQDVRLGFDITGYPDQFYDRKLSIAQADRVHLSSGRNTLNARLLATTLVDTLINDATDLPIRNTLGVVEIYSGTVLLERRQFQTDANGTYTVALSTLIDRDVRLGYQVNGYTAQFADRKRSLAQADPVRLLSGLNIRTTRLLATALANKLIDDASGLPIPNLTGSVEIYSGTALLESLPFTTDGQGVFTVSLKALLDQDVRLGYRAPGYPFQFYDRKPTLAQAQPAPLIVGSSMLTTRLKSMTLVNTLIDDSTGEPLRNAAGAIDASAGAMLIEHRSFSTDASGTYTTTFSSLIDQPIALGYSVDGYAHQFYDRQRMLERANLVQLASGSTKLTTRLLPRTVLVNQLLDNLNRQPVRDTAGTVTLYAGTGEIESKQFRTDASGVYTATFTTLISESTRIAYSVAGYPKQYADGKISLDQADAIDLRSGSNSLISHLLPMPSLAVTLIDDPTGQPIPNISGSLTVHWAHGVEYVPFTTDASGVYTATFRTDSDSTVPIGQGLILEYSYIPGYSDQYYDRVYTTGEATRVVLRSGPNQIATRIARPPTTLAATLMDGPYRLEMKHVHVSIERDTGAVFEQDYISDVNGQLLIEAGWLMGTDFRLRFHVEGFPDQYIGGTTRFDQASLVPLYSGPNYRTFQIARYATMLNTLVDDDSGAPLANIVGQLRVYTDTNSFMTFPFDTDHNGVMLLQLEGLNVLDDNVRLEYEVSGYPTQFHDRKATYSEAAPVLLQNGNTTFTTRLSKAVVRPATPTPPPSPTPPPLPIGPGLVEPQVGGSLRYTDTLTLSLQFPPGAVTEPVSVTVTSQSVEKLMPGTRAVGPAFDVRTRNQVGALVSNFGQPMAMRIQYDSAIITGVDESSLFIAYWDTASQAWLAIPTQRDPHTYTLSAAIDRPGLFAVFGLPRWKLYLPVVAR